VIWKGEWAGYIHLAHGRYGNSVRVERHGQHIVQIGHESFGDYVESYCIESGNSVAKWQKRAGWSSQGLNGCFWDPWLKKYSIGDRVTGEVVGLSAAVGVLIELEFGIIGLIAQSNASGSMEIGDEVEVVILEISKEKFAEVSLGMNMSVAG
jgi:hypothetical protein